MNWYYAEKGKQSGPVTEAQLGALLRKGTITVETLIWRDGLPGWAPYRQVFGGAPPPDPSGPIEPPTGPEAVCTKCGKMFPLQQTIRHGEGRICNTCRPIVLQKSQQNANPGGLSYAPILTRFAAVFLDGLILGAINMTLAYLMGGLDITQTDPRKILATQGLLLAITAAIAMTYEGVMVGTYGATLGKMACRIKWSGPTAATSPISGLSPDFLADS